MQLLIRINKRAGEDAAHQTDSKAAPPGNTGPTVKSAERKSSPKDTSQAEAVSRKPNFEHE